MEPATIAACGNARLVMVLTERGKEYRLIGGMEADRTEAREWIARFMKGETVREDWEYTEDMFLRTKRQMHIILF